MLRKHRADKAAVTAAVLVEPHVVLAAVDDLGVQAPGIGAPGKVGDVAGVVEILHVQPDGLAGGEGVNAHGNNLGGHAVHGVVDELELSGAGFNVQEGELGNLALVFLVKRHLGGIRRQVPSGIDAELVAAHAFSVNGAGIRGLGNADGDVLITVFYIQAAFFREEGEPALGGRRPGGHLVPGDAGIAHSFENGLFHGEVFTRMGRAGVNNPVLRKSKSAGEKGACSYHPFIHIML